MSVNKKWWQIYQNDEEKKFFVGKDGNSGLARSKFEWRTTEALSRESGLSKAAVEKLIEKYHKAGVVIAHQKDPEKWGYWENVAAQSMDKKDSVADADKKDRMDKAKTKI